MRMKTISPANDMRALRSLTPRCVLVLLFSPLLSFSQGLDRSGHQESLRTVIDFQRLNNAQAGNRIPVELRAVVTYSDPEWGLLFLQDQTGAIFIDVHGTKTAYPAGARVQLNGVTGAGVNSPILVQPKIQVLSRGLPPKAERRSVADLDAGKSDSVYVATEGVLQSCDANWNRVCFRIFDGQNEAWVVAPETDSEAAKRLLGAKVRVTGVSGSHFDAQNRRVCAQLFINSLRDFELEKPAEPAAGPSPLPHTLISVEQVHNLSNAEAAKKFPVVLDGLVTYSDPEWGLLFVHDQTGSIYINVHGTTTVYPLGTHVRVNGITGPGDTNPIVAQAKVLVLGSGTPPIPDRKSVAELDAGVADSSWVVTEGVLHPCDQTWTRVCFRMFDGKTLAWVIVPSPDSPAAQSLIGAKVRVRGVAGVHLDAQNKRAGAQVFVNSLQDIVVEVPALKDPFSAAIIPIGDLRASEASLPFMRQIHIRGTVTWESPGRFMVQDRSGAMSVETAKTVVVHPWSTVDVVGFPSNRELYPLTLSDSNVRMSAVQANKDAVVPLDLTAEQAVKPEMNGMRVRLRARLLSQSANQEGYDYQFEDGDVRFTAELMHNDATREIVSLLPNSALELTGVAVLQGATPERPGHLLILIESPSDMAQVEGNGWFTVRHVLSVLSVMGGCVGAALFWVTLLRRTVHKQTEIIRERLESELQLEKKYQRLVERNLAAVFRWRSDGTIVDFNMAFVNLLGLESRDQLIGRSYWDFEVDPAQREQLLGALELDALSNRETSLRRDDGTTVGLLMNITPVHTADGMVFETTAIDITQLRQNQAELQSAKDAAVVESLHDPLTGLPNRRLLSEQLVSRLAQAKRESTTLALLYIDLDGFKMVNDSLGHSAGDALLVQVAIRLRTSVRASDILARLGGDEFMVILEGGPAREDALLVAEGLLDAISDRFWIQGHEINIGASIGMSIFPDSAAEAEEMMRQADTAMYAAKREGKNRVTSFTPEIGSVVHDRLGLENLLRGAIARREIFVHYQPEFDLADNRLIRFEALARWTHPTLGKIPPTKFITIAEESGLIAPLGAFIMQQACAEAIRWQNILPYPIQVAVNVSSIQFRRKGFVEEVSAILRETGLRHDLLQIELTESVMLSGAHDTVEIMKRLRELGISLVIDDFGTGYSNLSYLPSLRFDALKIDRTFVMNLDGQPEAESMIHTLIALAHNIGMRVIVEGVETSEQLELIRSFGAEEVQGFLLGRPTPNPIEAFLIPARDCAIVL